MTTVLVLALLILPLAVAAACLWLPVSASRTATVATGLISLAAVVLLVPGAAGHATVLWRYLRVDAISVVFLLATAFLYASVAVYSVGYLRDEPGPGFRRYARRFYAGLNLFAWAMLAAPLMSSLALLWIAIEVTTVVSALLVAIENTDGAVEAAWKYVLIASAGLGIALLATVVMYYAGARALGQPYDLTFASLLGVGGHLPATPVRLAFALAVLGFGTKVGLFPVHTWLPDAHAEAPTPVSALLSGSLLAVSFYAILRYYQVALAALGPRFPQGVLLAFGVASLLLAALYLLDQRDVKRLLAYSSVEHMGVLAIAVGFGAPIALFGAFLHVLAHAAAKGNAFMAAGVLVHRYGTKNLASIRGVLDRLPWTGPILLLTMLALFALPPFGIFRSEFLIVAGGLGASRTAASAVLVVLVTVAFLGLAAAANRMLFAAPSDAPGAAAARGEPSAWMVVPLVAGLVVLLVLGVHPPDALSGLLSRAAADLGGMR
ncbi:MAG TPA: proton-conducting transporter membrane subunit [Streptosporangiaceae bacterium]|jgi:hydrogenase-4 component F